MTKSERPPWGVTVQMTHNLKLKDLYTKFRDAKTINSYEKLISNEAKKLSKDIKLENILPRRSRRSLGVCSYFASHLGRTRRHPMRSFRFYVFLRALRVLRGKYIGLWAHPHKCVF